MNSNTTKHMRLLKDTVVFAVGGIGSKLVLFLLIPIYTNYMSLFQYGTSELIFTTAQLIIPFTSVVIYDSMIRFGLMRNSGRADVLFCGCIVIAIGSILLVFAVPCIGTYDALAPWKWYLYAYVVVSMLNIVLMTYIKVLELNRLYAQLSILQSILLTVFSAVFIIKMHLGIRGYMYAYIISLLLTSVVTVLCADVVNQLLRSKFQFTLFMNMIKFSSPLILNNVSWWLIQSSGKIVISAVVGASALGFYSVAVKIPTLINVITSLFTQAWNIASIREIETTNDPNYYKRVFNAISVYVFGVCVIAIAVIEPFMNIYVGKQFVTSWRYVPILLMGALCAFMAEFLGSLYRAMKLSVNVMTTTLVSCCVNIIICLALVRRYEVWGIVIGSLVSYLVLVILRLCDMRRLMNINFLSRKVVLLSILVILEALLVLFTRYGAVIGVTATVIYVYLSWSEVAKICMFAMKRATLDRA